MHARRPSRIPRICLWLLLLVLITGCGGYGEVSPTAYEYAKALYSIANRQAGDRLESVSEQIQSARKSGDLSEQEESWLSDIIRDARNGRWESARRASWRIMQDQIR